MPGGTGTKAVVGTGGPEPGKRTRGRNGGGSGGY